MVVSDVLRALERVAAAPRSRCRVTTGAAGERISQPRVRVDPGEHLEALNTVNVSIIT